MLNAPTPASDPFNDVSKSELLVGMLGSIWEHPYSLFWYKAWQPPR